MSQETSHVQVSLTLKVIYTCRLMKKIQWVNTGTYISGTDTALTIDADDTFINADTTMTLTCPTINLSGNANVSNGLDASLENITHAQVILDIEGNIEMANARKIQWVNANTYISKVAIHHHN